jgi:hypothetical protein
VSGHPLAVAPPDRSAPVKKSIEIATFGAFNCVSADRFGNYIMTGNEYRDAKISELRTVISDWNALKASTYSAETKIRLFRSFRRRAHDLIALLQSPALAAICS